MDQEVGDRQEPEHRPTGNPPAAAEPARPDPDAMIERPQNVLTGIVLPVILLVAVLLVVMMPGSWRLASACDNFIVIQLVYPLIFGALGATIGGNVRLAGPIRIFNTNWNGVVAGGIGAALLGFGITAYIKPSSCEPRQEILLQQFIVKNPVLAIDAGRTVMREYIGKIDWSDTKLEMIVANSENYSRNLRLLFTGDDEFTINLDFYRRANPDAYYQPVASCPFKINIGSPPPGKDKLKFKLSARDSRNQVHVNPNIFEQLEQELKKNPSAPIVDCIMAQGLLDGDTAQPQEKPVKELYLVPASRWPISIFKPVEMWFVAPAPKEQDTTTIAKGPEATEGAAPTSANASPARTTETAPPPSRVVGGCSPSDVARGDFDKYLAGDDLDQNRRMVLYGDWINLHCYVWSFVAGNDPTTTPAQRVRALRLTVGAILNTPATTDQIAGYWQPQGENKRDFSRDLPYLTSADYKTIFEMVKAEDVLLRGEAMRTIRYLPADKFETLFGHQVDTLNKLTPAEQERLAIAASFMYYNRIVEWLDDDPVLKPNAALVAVEYNAAKRWIMPGLLGRGTNGYDAMLLYAKGIVEHEKKLATDLGQNTFAMMVTAVEGMEDSYPSNVRHIAQGLAFALGGNDVEAMLGLIKQVDVYPSGTPLAPLDPPATGNQEISAGPLGSASKHTVTIDPAKSFLLLRKDDWYLGNGPGWVGWLHRPPKTTG